MKVGPRVDSADDSTEKSFQTIRGWATDGLDVNTGNDVMKCMYVKELSGVKGRMWWIVDDHCTGGSSDWGSI